MNHLTFLVTSCMLPVLAAACPTGLPTGLKGIPIEGTINLSGLSMQMIQVEGREPVPTILSRTAAAWIKSGYDVRQSESSEWKIVSGLSETCMTTLQLTSRKDGSFGFFAWGFPKPAKTTPQSIGMPVPDGAKILSTVESNDDGRTGLTVVMSSLLSLDELHQYFTQRLVETNWGGVRAQKLVAATNGKATLLVHAQRQREQIEIVVWPDKQSQVVMTVSAAL